jgi:hypothetical protein
MNDIKKIFKILLIFPILFFFYLFIYNLIYFQGNKLLYFFFSFLSFYLITSVLVEEKKYFSEVFLSIYLWLGFWWKYSILQWYSKSDLIVLSSSEGFNSRLVEAKVLDETFLSLIISFIAIIVSLKVFKKFIKSEYNVKNIEEKFFTYLYLKYRKYILLSFSFLFITVGILNLYYGIYQKGLINNINLNFFVLSFYKWLILLGVTMVGTIILFYEIKIKSKKIFFVSILVLIQNFFISSSNLSRAMILESSSILYGLNNSVKKFASRDYVKIFKLVIIMFLLFFLSFATSKILRKKFFSFDYVVTEKNFNDKKIELQSTKKNLDFLAAERDNFEPEPDKKPDKKKKIEFALSANFINKVILFFKSLYTEIFYLLSKRWVGIDSMIIVTDYSDRDFSTFFGSFKDKLSKGDNPYYEKNFVDRFNNYGFGDFPDREIAKYNKKGQQIYGILTPGFISYLHYTNNNFFLFFSIFFIIIVVLSIEKFFYFFSGNNLVLVSFLSHLVIYRLVHFGYLPNQTYLFFGSIFLTLFFLFFLKKIFLKYKRK